MVYLCETWGKCFFLICKIGEKVFVFVILVTTVHHHTMFYIGRRAWFSCFLLGEFCFFLAL